MNPTKLKLCGREVSASGNKEILKEQNTAFFCSRKFPASIVLKTYDWATEMRDQGKCVISGFHSQIEKDVLHFLLKGSQPIIMVHARNLKKRETPEILEAVEQNRLLINLHLMKKINVFLLKPLKSETYSWQNWQMK